VNGLIHTLLSDYASVRGVDLPEDAMFEQHPDASTIARVARIAELVGSSEVEVLRDFGSRFPELVRGRGYGSVLAAMGPSYTAFLGQLDAMHAGLSVSFPGVQMPSFSLESADEARCTLLYRSIRGSLTPLAVGILEGSARLFELTVDVVVERRRLDGAVPIVIVRGSAGGRWR
tara:strand:- start:2208 stop:2729 length:522 start_codon:yes stop_codon:yes gene_type:complete